MAAIVDRIRTTHAGALPRSPELTAMVRAKSEGRPYDPAEYERRLGQEVTAIVRRQAALGLDGVNDGELSKTSFLHYSMERIAGFEIQEYRPGGPQPLSIAARDLTKFREYFEAGHGGFVGAELPKSGPVCVGPLTYVGETELKRDIANFKAALDKTAVGEAWLPANSPGTLEHALRNAHYPGEEAYLEALGEVLRVEYKAITEAGLLLQIDDPDLPDGWLMYPEMTVPEYRRYAGLRVEALNHALRGIPREQIRLHVCWGSFKGPHQDDIPLRDIIDLIFKVKAASYSIEASNPAHEHEWQLFESVRLPEGAVLIPGVIGHCTDFIEHPDLVAQRLVRYAGLVGRENVIGSTDCGIGPRVKHPKIAWAKLGALVEGARRATKQLWGRA